MSNTVAPRVLPFSFRKIPPDANFVPQGNRLIEGRFHHDMEWWNFGSIFVGALFVTMGCFTGSAATKAKELAKDYPLSIRWGEGRVKGPFGIWLLELFWDLPKAFGVGIWSFPCRTSSNSGRQQPLLMTQVFGDSLRARLNVKLLINAAKVRSNRINADVQLIRDLLVGKTFCQAIQHHLFAR